MFAAFPLQSGIRLGERRLEETSLKTLQCLQIPETKILEHKIRISQHSQWSKNFTLQCSHCEQFQMKKFKRRAIR